LDKTAVHPLIHEADSGKNYLLLFLLWPFLAFILAVKNFSQKEARIVVYCFLIYFGFNFVIDTGTYTDAFGYSLNLIQNAQYPISEFRKVITGFYSHEKSMDIIEPFISFWVSRFTVDYHVLFAVYAAVFGFFYIKCISLLHNSFLKSPNINTALHLAFFVLILPITAINGFRMWTAAWIYLYGSYFVIIEHNKKYLLVAFSSILVHFSFLSANVILLIYFLAGNRNFIYFPLVVLSFILPALLGSFFQEVSFALGGGFQSRYENYSNIDYITYKHQALQNAPWFIRLAGKSILYYLIFAISFIRLRYNDLLKDRSAANLYSFLLLFLSFVNFSQSIPSLGSRFQIIFFLLATMFVFLMMVKLDSQEIHLLSLVGFFPMLLYTLVQFRQVSIWIDTWIFSPLLGMPFAAPVSSLGHMLFN
jgi:hypothetical protein